MINIGSTGMSYAYYMPSLTDYSMPVSTFTRITTNAFTGVSRKSFIKE